MANVRSLRDEQELSFVAPEDDEDERATARETELSDGRRLPVHTVLGVFGPNASGKSNVSAALRNMRRCVMRSYAEWTSYDGIPCDEFALDVRLRTRSAPSGSTRPQRDVARCGSSGTPAGRSTSTSPATVSATAPGWPAPLAGTHCC
ncbi:hypothetical protein [Streptomyces sp. NPDC047841]|uniref:hypothetical protein n=1 Tax=Streptomyces sp. NPDC047841 TaxID=3154708 RepID=UPI0034568147